jgi:hypothetical protein
MKNLRSSVRSQSGQYLGFTKFLFYKFYAMLSQGERFGGTHRLDIRQVGCGIAPLCCFGHVLINYSKELPYFDNKTNGDMGAE